MAPPRKTLKPIVEILCKNIFKRQTQKTQLYIMHFVVKHQIFCLATSLDILSAKIRSHCRQNDYLTNTKVGSLRIKNTESAMVDRIQITNLSINLKKSVLKSRRVFNIIFYIIFLYFFLHGFGGFLQK